MTKRLMSGQEDVQWSRERQQIDAVLKVRQHRVTRGMMSGKEVAEWPRGIGTFRTVASSPEGSGGRGVVRKPSSLEGVW